MKTALFYAGCMAFVLSLTACQSVSNLFAKVDNGSLAYSEAKQLEPLQLPAEQQAAAFTPLYPTPNVGNNTLELQNEQGTRYVLPPPKRTVQ